jgi:hypothetical protein
MGHTRLGELPATRNWRQVVALLNSEADTPEIAQATAVAAEQGLSLADQDEGLLYSWYLLCHVPLAARTGQFADSLTLLGISVPPEPSLFDIASGFAEAVDSHQRSAPGRTDIGEMARLSAVETLMELGRRRTPSLIGSAADDTRDTLREHSTSNRFGILAHEFFARFMNRFLAYHLSRELSRHVGPGQRFSDIAQHNAFNDALDLHCRQAARIVQEFAGDWYGKANYEAGITLRKAKGFVRHALEKLRDELARRGGEHATA